MRNWLDANGVGERGGEERLCLLHVMSLLGDAVRDVAGNIYEEEMSRIRETEEPDNYEPDYEFIVSRATMLTFSRVQKVIASINAWKAVRKHFKKKKIVDFWNKLVHVPSERNLKRLFSECFEN